MDVSESKLHSFIVKLWLENAGDETGKLVWRGYITHVPSGERRHLKKLKDVTNFIGRYLEEMGVEQGLLSRLRCWLRRLNIWSHRGL